MPHTDRPGAAVLAERLRKSAAGHIHSNGRQSERATISLGVASFPLDEAGSGEELIECADLRLCHSSQYMAAESGLSQPAACFFASSSLADLKMPSIRPKSCALFGDRK